jgi:hypothetical protein
MSQYFIKVRSCDTNKEPEWWSRQIVSPSQSNLFWNSGNVGIGVPNPLAKLQVDGSASVGSAYATTTPPASGLIVSGNVGIGVPNPSYKTEIAGVVRVGTTASTSVLISSREVKLRDDNQAHFSIFNELSTFSIRNTSAGDVGTPGTAIISIPSTNNVGIGTTIPLYKLHVSGTFSSGQIISGSGLTPASISTSVTSADSKIVFYDFGANNWCGTGVDGGGSWWLRHGNGSTNLIVAKYDGNVGIGITNAQAKLDVAGAIRASGTTNSFGLVPGGAQSAAVSGQSPGGSPWIGGAFGSGGSGNRVVMGLQGGSATIGAHSYALDAWTPLQIANGTIVTISDANTKENIVDADISLCYDNIKRLHIVRYNYDSNVVPYLAEDHDKTRLGVLAQELEVIFPKSVTTMKDYDGTDKKAINLDQINYSLLGAFQQCQLKIEELTRRIELLETPT